MDMPYFVSHIHEFRNMWFLQLFCFSQIMLLWACLFKFLYEEMLQISKYVPKIRECSSGIGELAH